MTTVPMIFGVPFGVDNAGRASTVEYKITDAAGTVHQAFTSAGVTEDADDLGYYLAPVVHVDIAWSFPLRINWKDVSTAGLAINLAGTEFVTLQDVLSVYIPPGAPAGLLPSAVIGMLYGDILAPQVVTQLPLVPGCDLHIAQTVLHLPALAASCSCAIKLLAEDNVLAIPLVVGSVITPGALSTDGTYTAVLDFLIPNASSPALLPTRSYSFELQVTTVAGEVYCSAIGGQIVSLSGGPLG